MKLTQKEKIARFDDLAESRDRFELACYDLIVNRVKWSEWVTDRSVVIDGETPGRYRLGIIGEHRAAGPMAVFVYQLDGQNDQCQFAPWDSMARDIRHLSGRSEWAGLMRECLRTLEGIEL